MEHRRLTESEAEKISGGFRFDTDYYIRINNAKIICPVCHSEGSMEFVGCGWDGYSDGRRIAVDHRKCRVCQAWIALFPESNTMAIVDQRGEYSDELYTWEG